MVRPRKSSGTLPKHVPSIWSTKRAWPGAGSSRADLEVGVCMFAYACDRTQRSNAAASYTTRTRRAHGKPPAPTQRPTGKWRLISCGGRQPVAVYCFATMPCRAGRSRHPRNQCHGAAVYPFWVVFSSIIAFATRHLLLCLCTHQEPYMDSPCPCKPTQGGRQGVRNPLNLKRRT